MHNALTPANGEALPNTAIISLDALAALDGASLSGLIHAFKAEDARLDALPIGTTIDDELTHATLVLKIRDRMTYDTPECASTEEAAEALAFVLSVVKDAGLYRASILESVTRYLARTSEEEDRPN